MDFEKIKITDIIPAPYNPRIMSDDDKEKLRRSMSEYGLVDPIIINMKNMTIIGGHQRYDILLEGYAEEKEYSELNLIRLGDIGWVFTEDDLTIADEAHEKGLNLILNRVTGEWDNDKLNIVFKDLDEMNFDFDLTGFNSYDEEVHFSDLMNRVEFTTGNTTNTAHTTNTNDDKGIDYTEDNTTADDITTNTIETSDVAATVDNTTIDNNSPGYYQITLLFDTEEEMTEAFDTLVSEGYNCRMSDS